MKNKQKKPQFPRNYRRITENKDFLHALRIFKKMLILFIFFAFFIFILFLAADLFKNIKKYQEISFQRQKLIHEINIWQNFSDKYKNYKEAYFQIAVREYKLGDFVKTNQYLQKALLIDPNYDEAIKLEKVLNNK